MMLRIVNLTAVLAEGQPVTEILTEALSDAPAVLAVYCRAACVLARALARQQDPAEVLQAWMDGMQVALTVARGNRQRLLFVAADTLGAAPQKVLVQACDHLGLGGDQMPLLETVAEIMGAEEGVDPILLQLAESLRSSDLHVVALDGELEACALPSEVPIDTRTLLLSAARLYVEQGDEQRKLKDQLKQRGHQIATSRKEIEDLRRAYDAAEARGQRQQGQVELQRSQLTILQKALEDREGGIAGLREKVAGLEAERAQHAALLAEKDAQLEALWTSTSWRVTAPIRRVKLAFSGNGKD